MTTSDVRLETTAPQASRLRVVPLVVLGCWAFYVVHGLAFRVHNYDSSSVSSDVVLALVGSVLGGLVLAAVFWAVNRWGSARARALTGIVLGLVAALIYPLAYYLTWSLMWGIGAIMLAQDSDPGRARTAARVFGAIAVLEVLVTTVAWLLGSGWHPGCSPKDCHPR